MVDKEKIQIISFDCYGTLIDWEEGIGQTLKSFVDSKGLNIEKSALLEYYADFEKEEEAGFYRNYKQVLINILFKFSENFGFDVAPGEEDLLIESLKLWEPFPDTNASLLELKKKYKLAVISNIDNDLFSFTKKKFSVDFDYAVTAEDVKSYKPSRANFLAAKEKFDIEEKNWLHAAQSLFHDIEPCKKLGISSAYINRRIGLQGFGATPESNIAPDSEFDSLKSFSEFMLDKKS